MKHESDLRLHHIGIVVPQIEDRRAFYVDILQYKERTPIIHDPVQTAFVQFFVIPSADHYLELVAPDSESSKLQNASRKGPPLHHLCYSCVNVQQTQVSVRESGCFIIQEPAPALAFNGRPIAWLQTPDRVLVELVERGPEGSL
jgi:methylmalonyl-CoA/ethylmalonyl-CoA epimerase